MNKPSAVRNGAAFVLVSAMPVLVVWLVGPTTVEDPHPDYFMRPLTVPVALARIVPVGSLILGLTAVAALVWSWRTEPPPPGWASVVVPLAVVGAIIGLAYRTLTAGVIGVNIGAGIMVMFGTPVVVGLILVSLVSAWRRKPAGARAGWTRGVERADWARHSGALPPLASEPLGKRKIGRMTSDRDRPSIAVQAVVWGGLVILVVTVVAFVWLFVLGHGFAFA